MSRKRAAIKRAGYEHANLSAHARAAFAIARAEFEALGERQREALISCEPGVALAAVMRTEVQAYALRVRCSLQLRGLLEAGERWALTPWGALVRQAGGTCEGAVAGKQGNAMNNAIKTLTLGIALCTIPACGSGVIEAGTGETGSECLADCDDAGDCWARGESWGAWAQSADAATFDTFEPVAMLPGASCFAVPGADGHVCTVVVECTSLVGRPLIELASSPSECAAPGPWDSVASSGELCMGVVAGVAIILDVGP